MLASYFQLDARTGCLNFRAPAPVATNHQRLLAQGNEARQLLAMLNRAVCGRVNGPFQAIYLFNTDSQDNN